MSEKLEKTIELAISELAMFKKEKDEVQEVPVKDVLRSLDLVKQLLETSGESDLKDAPRWLRRLIGYILKGVASWLDRLADSLINP